MRARRPESASRNGVNTLRKKSRWRAESVAVMGGPSLFQTSDGTRVMTHAPFTRRRYGAKLSGVLASMRTTGPVTVAPPVPGAHAQLAAVTSCDRGAVRRTRIDPRVHVPPNFHGSDRKSTRLNSSHLVIS